PRRRRTGASDARRRARLGVAARALARRGRRGRHGGRRRDPFADARQDHRGGRRRGRYGDQGPEAAHARGDEDGAQPDRALRRRRCRPQAVRGAAGAGRGAAGAVGGRRVSDMLFRDATVADLPAILAMLAEDTIPANREADPADPRYLAAFQAIDADPDQRLIAAELDGRVVGTMQLSFLPGLSFRGSWRGLIEAVRIVADLRGQKL